MKNQITSFVHCRKCLAQLPRGESAETYARLAVGLTVHGKLQVWCNRHEENVALIPVAESFLNEMNIKHPLGCERCENHAVAH